MPESTAAVALVGIQAEVGHFLGYGRGEALGEEEWDARQQRDIDSCVNSGLHKFYFPPILPGDSAAHSWSFLKPITTLGLEEGKNHVLLPGDFGGIEGEAVLSSPTGQRSTPVPLVSTGVIERYRSLADDQSGPPQMAAIRPIRGTTTTRGQQFALEVYPEADQDYEIKVAYTLAPDVLTAVHPYPYGGPVHRETILEACLAVAEARKDDLKPGVGPHWMAFMECLRASVSHDRRFQPQMLGYNGDRKIDPGAYRYDSRLVTIAGSYST